MGMPKVLVAFSEKAISAIKRSSKGVVALVLKDDTKTFDLKEYRSFSDVSKDDWKEINYKNIERTFRGLPKKVYVLRLSESEEGTSKDYEKLLRKRVDYLAYPEASATEKTGLTDFFIGKRGEFFKLVLADVDADNEKVINVTMGIINKDEEIVTKEEMTARIAGILAGMSQEISSTYYVISEAKELIQEEIPENYDTAIDSGKLVFVDDGVKIKIARGVNSLRTLTETKGKSYKKIKLVEGMDMMIRDIKDTFEDEYAGKVLNVYMNKVQFIGAIKIYFNQLTKVGILDATADNTAAIDLKEQINYITLNSTLTEDEISDLSEQEIKEWNTGSFVYLTGKVKLADTMEDLVFPITL